MAEREIEAPPVGEQLHLPPPSILPLLNAAALAVAIVGVTSGLWMVIVGGALFLVTLVKWVLDVARDIEALPPEHGHH
jgi:hypothetical protein